MDIRKQIFVTECKTETLNFFPGEGLYSLISNVLFVPDKKEEGKYHPRIGVQRDFIFRSLSEVEKNAFNVDPVSIEVFRHFLETSHPPAVTVLFHDIPVVGRESPVLSVYRASRRRQIIRISPFTFIFSIICICSYWPLPNMLASKVSH